ncbi:DeoR/GlpR family DNA-binding transcription regulator [Roseobacteraceae bacterium S113]
MPQAIRHPEILEIARRDGKVTVDGLAAHFDVTVQTVRRDLSDLADAGQLTRVHGGAVLPSATRNIAHDERRALHAEAKAAIARRCAKAIPNGASLFLNIGTSTEAVAQELLHHDGLLIVTNNLNAAQILQANPALEIIMTGGTLRRADGGLIGPQAIETVRQFHLDFAVMGCSALTREGDMLDYDLDEVGVSRAILHSARRAFLVADRSKFDRSAPARIGSIAEIDTMFTNAPLPDSAQDKCSRAGTRIELGFNLT